LFAFTVAIAADSWHFDVTDFGYIIGQREKVYVISEKLKLQLDTYIEIISSLKWVLQVFLFGSHAYGEPQEYSDLDLLVIVDDNQDPIKAMYKINQQLIGKRTTPLDVVVNRKKDFESAVKENTIQRLISDNGVLLYEAS
jgi:predicted nucleotidyltransferase